MWIRSMVHSEEDITIWYGNKKKITCNSPTHFFKLIIASSSVLFSAIGMLLVQVPMISFHGHNVVSAEIWERGLIIQWKQNLISGILLVSALSHHLFTFPCYLIIHFHVSFPLNRTDRRLTTRQNKCTFTPNAQQVVSNNFFGGEVQAWGISSRRIYISPQH